MTITAAKSLISSKNEAWGFRGTISRTEGAEETLAAAAWAIAVPALIDATGCPDTAVRDFLDSRRGRHFADEVGNHLHAGRSLETAIGEAVATWMAWTINSRTSQETGIPEGLPYLTGFIMSCEIEAEAAA